MLRRLVAKNFQNVRSISYLSTFENDKWTNDKMKAPVNRCVELSPSDVSNMALDLFRHAYNTKQMGYYFKALQVLDRYGVRNQGFPKVYSDHFVNALKINGVPEEIYNQVLPAIYQKNLEAQIASFIKAYEYYFGGYFKTVFGILTLTHYIPSRMVTLRDKMKYRSLSVSRGYKLFTSEIIDFRGLGGWSIEAHGVRVGEDYLGEIREIQAQTAHEKIFEKKY